MCAHEADYCLPATAMHRCMRLTTRLKEAAELGVGERDFKSHRGVAVTHPPLPAQHRAGL